MPDYHRPKAVIYVADTTCCGLVVHDPRRGGVPCHGRRAGKDDHLPANDSYPTCNVLRYWEYGARRQIARAEILKTKD